jgi:hypothetical protein
MEWDYSGETTSDLFAYAAPDRELTETLLGRLKEHRQTLQDAVTAAARAPDEMPGTADEYFTDDELAEYERLTDRAVRLSRLLGDYDSDVLAEAAGALHAVTELWHTFSELVVWLAADGVHINGVTNGSPNVADLSVTDGGGNAAGRTPTGRVKNQISTCQRCGDEFGSSRYGARYCSNSCRQAAYRERA